MAICHGSSVSWVDDASGEDNLGYVGGMAHEWLLFLEFPGIV